GRGVPRDGMPLQLAGHPLHAARPVVSSTWPADSTPGEIYPSEIEVPAPGCWQFTLSWNGHTDTIDLWYVRHREQRNRRPEAPRTANHTVRSCPDNGPARRRSVPHTRRRRWPCAERA